MRRRKGRGGARGLEEGRCRCSGGACWCVALLRCCLACLERDRESESRPTSSSPLRRRRPPPPALPRQHSTRPPLDAASSMTRSTLQRTLRLLPSGHWAPSPRPLNLALRHPRSAPPPPQPAPAPTPRARPHPAFDTLASDTTAAPSLQGVPAPRAPDSAGPRSATPLEAAQPAGEGEGQGEGGAQGAQEARRRRRSVLGVKLPDKPKPPEADGASPPSPLSLPHSPQHLEQAPS